MSSSPARTRRAQLWSILGSPAYNTLIHGGMAIITPLDSRRFYTFSSGEGRIGPESDLTGVDFDDGSFLKLFEKWQIKDGTLLEYSYHYQVPGGVSIRYEMDSARAAPGHPEYHLHTSALGEEYRLPTSRASGEDILRMIFEQFVMPKK
jgi:Family of unknown function (DUF6516)